jgi:hypothetical protein
MRRPRSTISARRRLSRSSPYAAFGGKRDLLLLALVSYSEHSTARIAEPLAKRPIRKTPAGLAQLFIDQVVARPDRSG